jgi:hypothetical protein
MHPTITSRIAAQRIAEWHQHAARQRMVWTAPVILEALIPGRMQSHASTAEVPRGAA